VFSTENRSMPAAPRSRTWRADRQGPRPLVVWCRSKGAPQGVGVAVMPCRLEYVSVFANRFVSAQEIARSSVAVLQTAVRKFLRVRPSIHDAHSFFSPLPTPAYPLPTPCLPGRQRKMPIKQMVKPICLPCLPFTPTFSCVHVYRVCPTLTHYLYYPNNRK
jgi:hypothetical protein